MVYSFDRWFFLRSCSSPQPPLLLDTAVQFDAVHKADGILQSAKYEAQKVTNLPRRGVAALGHDDGLSTVSDRDCELPFVEVV